MRRKRTLPETLRQESAAKKLIWLYITINGEAEYSTRMLEEELGIQQGVCARYLRALTAEGWLERVRTPVAGKPGVYRALTPSELQMPTCPHGENEL